MTILAKFEAIAVLTVDVSTPPPVQKWDSSFNRTVYNPYGFQTIANNSPIPQYTTGTVITTTLVPTTPIGGSILFNGSNQFLTTPSNAFTALQSNDFTLEFWVNFTDFSVNVNRAVYSNYTGAFTTNNIYIGKHTTYSGAMAVWFGSFSTGAAMMNESSTPPAGWNHYAITRQGSTFRLFRNGVQTASGTFAGAVTAATNFDQIGGNAGGGSFVQGLITNFRIINGFAQYTNNFIAPVLPLSTGTVGVFTASLVLNVSSATTFLTDTSINRQTITNNNTAVFDLRTPLFTYTTATSTQIVNVGIGQIGAPRTTRGVSGQGATVIIDQTVIRPKNNFLLNVNNANSGGHNIGFGGNQYSSALSPRPVIANPLITKANPPYTSSRVPAPTWESRYNRTVYEDITFNVVVNNSPYVVSTTASNTVTSLIYPSVSGSLRFSGTPVPTADGGSLLFNNAGNDAVVVSTSTNYGFGTGDFTIEGWFFPLLQTGVNQTIIDFRTSGLGAPQLKPTFRADTAVNTYAYFVNGAARITTGALTSSTWYHFAIARVSGNTRLYINGIQTGTTYTDVNDYGVSSDFIIGQSGDTRSTTANFFQGYITNVRILKGYGLYALSANVPNTPLGATLGTTQLLTAQSISSAVIDSSANNNVITNVGTVVQTTATPFISRGISLVATGSVQFNGTSQYLTVANNTAFDFGAGDFTIEAWVYLTSLNPGNYVPIFSNAYLFYVGSVGQVLVYDGVANVVSGTSNDVLANVWTHLAYVRSGTTLRVYSNGVLKASATVSASIGSGTPNRIFNSSINTAIYGQGYVSNLRIVKGTAVYTSGPFPVPAAPLTAISGTSLLTAQSTSTIVDASGNNFAITNVGTAVGATSNPFGGGSAFFTTGQYLTLPNNSAFSIGAGDNFTVELWAYLTASPSNYTFMFSLYDGTNELTIRTGDAGFGYTVQVAFGPSILASVFRNASYTTTTILNKWTHLALSRSNGVATFYINGVAVDSKTSNSISLGTITAVSINSSNSIYSFPGYLSNIRFVKGTAVYTSNFSVSTTPLTAIDNTQLLTLQSGSSFTDASINAFAITNFNSTVASGLSPFPNVLVPFTTLLGGSSLFNGTSQYLTVPYSTNLNVGATTNYTVEFWFNLNSVAANSCAVALYQDTTNRWTIEIPSSTTVNVFFGAAGSTVFTLPSTLVVGTWYHMALSGVAGGARLYLNGIASATANAKNLPSLASGTLYIGQTGFAGTNLYFNGYLSNVRVSSASFYTVAGFTAPTRPLTTATTGTVYLLGARSADAFLNDSSNINTTTNRSQGFGVIATGPAFSNYNPFTTVTDYLSVINPGPIQPGTAQFSFDAWVYLPPGGGGTLYSQGALAGGLRIDVAPTGISIMQNGFPQPTYIPGLQSIPVPNLTNTWRHIAVTRDAGNQLRLYVDGTTATSVANITTNFSAVGPSRIGAESRDLTNPFTGYVTGLRMINGATLFPTLFSYTQPPTLPDNPPNRYARFNGTDGYLTMPDSIALSLAGWNWTIECLVNPSGNYANYNTLWSKRSASGTSYQGFLNITNGWIGFYNGGTIWVAPGVQLKADTWSHCAWVYNLTALTVSIYVNGALVLTVPAVTITNIAGAPLAIGANFNGSAYQEYMWGSISNVRITRGLQLYTGTNFIVPNMPLTTATTATVLLTLNGPFNTFTDISTGSAVITRGGTLQTSVTTPTPLQHLYLTNETQATAFRDSSTSNNAIIFSGTPTWVSTLTPYVYTTSTLTLGSVQFNGTTDYLTTTTSTNFALGLQDFTVETWAYLQRLASNGVANGAADNNTFVWDFRSGISTGAVSSLYVDNTDAGKLKYYANGAIVITGNTPSINTWTHIAVTRASGITRLFVNGVQQGTNYLDAINYAAAPLTIGAESDGNTRRFLQGFITNFRVVGGVSMYTTNTSVPLAPFVLGTSTQFLLQPSPTNTATDTAFDIGVRRVGTPSFSTSTPFIVGTTSTRVITTSSSALYFRPSGNGIAAAVTVTSRGNGITTNRSRLTYSLTLDGVNNGTTPWTFPMVVNPYVNKRFGLRQAPAITEARANITRTTYERFVFGETVYNSIQVQSRITTSTATSIVYPSVNGSLRFSGIPVSPAVGGSLLFNNSLNDAIVVSTSTNLGFGTGDFTIEGWFYPLLQTGVNQGIIDFRTSGGGASQNKPTFKSDTAANTYAYFAGGIQRIITGALTSSTWYHFAISRNSGSTRMYINGTQTGVTYTDATDYGVSSDFIIGNTGDTRSTAANFFQGYIDGVRVLKGYGLYPGGTAFTPSTTPLSTATTGTVFVLNVSSATSYLVDSSTSSFVVSRSLGFGVTASGPTFSQFNPFTTNTDYLTIINPGAMQLAGQFTFESWIYLTTSTACTLYSQGAFPGGLRIDVGATTISVMQTGYYLAPTYLFGLQNVIVPNLLNTWRHVAVTRDVSNNIRIFVDGVNILTNPITITNGVNFSSIGPARIGADSRDLASPFQGFITSMRIINGTALYTTNLFNAIPTLPPYPIVNTQFLLPTETSATTYRDTSLNNTAITFAGTPTWVSTSTPYVYNTLNIGSLQFNGTTDFLSFTGNANLVLGVQDWTVEFWTYFTALPAQTTILDLRGSAAGVPATFNVFGPAGSPANCFTLFDGTAHRATTGITPAINTWYHVVYSKVNGTLRILVNGVVYYSAADAVNYTTGNNAIQIGRGQDASGFYLSGSLTNLRISRGVGFYTASTAAPVAPLTTGTSTQLLLTVRNGPLTLTATDNGQFADSSFNNFILTRNGTINYTNTLTPFVTSLTSTQITTTTGIIVNPKIRGYTGVGAPVLVDTGVRARFNPSIPYNIPVSTFALVPTGLVSATPTLKIGITVNYSNAVFFNRTLNVATATMQANFISRTIQYTGPVVKRLNDGGAKTFYNRQGRPATVYSGPINVVRKPVVYRVHIPTIARRFSDIGPKTLNIQLNGARVLVRSTALNLIVKRIAYRIPNPIYIRNLKDTGPIMLNVQLNGVKISGQAVPLFTVVVPGTANQIISPNSPVAGYWS